jgi:ElaB/YqjD/DUF883 family membrane-anchored ribosome-binding protein
MNHQTQGEQMKRTSQDNKQPFNSVTESAPAAHGAVESGRTMAEKVSNAAHAVRERVEERGAEALDQAKRKAGQIYDQANKSLNEQYGKAMEYGRENPGKMTLIAFGVGVGVGVGLVVAGGYPTPHSRRRRMVEPVMNALSSIAHELFR